VQSATNNPTPPIVVNIVETKISNNLIIVKPPEVQNAIKEAKKTQKDKENQAMEDEVTRKLTTQVSKNSESSDARIFQLIEEARNSRCNPTTGICVSWEHPSTETQQSKGKGTAFRILGTEDYAEVKTPGYTSNTSVTIIQNFSTATMLIGDGSPGGNKITIIQNPGVIKP
jgi:hypothetical protein